MAIRYGAFLTWLISGVLIGLAPQVRGAESNPKPAELTLQDVVARHLESLGTPEALKAAAGRVLKGSADYTSSRRVGKVTAPFNLASAGPRYLVQLVYGHKDYPYDRIVYDGEKVQVGQVISPGRYSALCALLTSRQFLLKQGLFGGALTTAWPLLSSGSDSVRLKYVGLKKVDGRELHRIDCDLEKDPDEKVQLFFEPESFRHVRTSYWTESNGPRGEGGSRLEESFSDFRPEGGLTLAHEWVVKLDDPGDVWEFTVNDFGLVPELPPSVFTATPARPTAQR